MGLGLLAGGQGGLAAALKLRRFADFGTTQTATITVKLLVAILWSVGYYGITTAVLQVTWGAAL